MSAIRGHVGGICGNSWGHFRVNSVGFSEICGNSGNMYREAEKRVAEAGPGYFVLISFSMFLVPVVSIFFSCFYIFSIS